MDSTHTILSHLFIVICLFLPPSPSPPTQPTPPHSQNQRTAHPSGFFCSVNNRSCVTLQITQTAYHLFIVVYHNNYLVSTKATGSQTQAFVNELGRLPDLKINCQCCCFRPSRACIPASPLFTPQRKNRDCSSREQALLKLNWMSVYTGIVGAQCWSLRDNLTAYYLQYSWFTGTLIKKTKNKVQNCYILFVCIYFYVYTNSRKKMFLSWHESGTPIHLSENL